MTPVTMSDSGERVVTARSRGRRTRSRHSRFAILAAARELLRNRSSDAVSMELVALHAGVTRRTVYNQFADSAELFRAVREELMRDVAGLLPDPSPSGLSPGAALRHYCAAVAEAFRDPRYVELVGSLVRDGWMTSWLVERYQHQVRLPLTQRLEACLAALPTDRRWSESERRSLALGLLGSIESMSVSSAGLVPRHAGDMAAGDCMPDLIDGFISRVAMLLPATAVACG